MKFKQKTEKGIFLIRTIFNKYKKSINSFGFIASTKVFVGDFIILLIENNIITSKNFVDSFFSKRHSLVKNMIINKYGDVIKQEPTSKEINSSINDGPIWFCWLQGESEMPEYVRFCYESIKRNGNRKVNLITKSNYAEYIELPNYIIEKVDKGLFSYTFFADILRVNLLYKYGGLWSDSRILLTQPLSQTYFNYDFFTIKNKPKKNWFVSNYRWTVGFIACTRNSPICYILKNLFAEYVKKEDFLIDYFLTDYIIAIAYEYNLKIKQLIDTVPYTNDYFFIFTAGVANSGQTLSIPNRENSIFLLPKFKGDSFNQTIKENKSLLGQILHSANNINIHK